MKGSVRKMNMERYTIFIAVMIQLYVLVIFYISYTIDLEVVKYLSLFIFINHGTWMLLYIIHSPRSKKYN